MYARHYENGGDPPYVAKKYRDLERTKSILKERLRNNQLSIVSYVKNIGGICLKVRFNDLIYISFLIIYLDRQAVG